MGERREGAAAVKRRVKNGIFVALAIAGAAFLAYGIASGQAVAVLNKAIRICMECIGIG